MYSWKKENKGEGEKRTGRHHELSKTKSSKRRRITTNFKTKKWWERKRN